MQTRDAENAAQRDGAATSQTDTQPLIRISTDEEIARRYGAGETYEEIGRALGVSVRRISAAVTTAGLPRRKGGSVDLPNGLFRTASGILARRNAYRPGVSLPEISILETRP